MQHLRVELDGLVECGAVPRCGAGLGLICARPLLTQTPLPPNHSALTSVATEHMERMRFPPTEEFTRTLTVAQGGILVKFKNKKAHDNTISRSYRVMQWDFLI